MPALKIRIISTFVSAGDIGEAMQNHATEFTESQTKFLREMFGPDASWGMILESLIRARMNQAMAEMLKYDPPSVVPPRAPNPLMIPAADLPEDCPAARRLAAEGDGPTAP